MLGWDDCSKFSRYQPRDPWCIMYKTFEVTWRGLEVVCVCVCFASTGKLASRHRYQFLEIMLVAA